MTDIYAKLREEHARHRKLLADIAANNDPAERRELFQGFVADVEAHAAAEEQSFYAALIEKPDGSDEARHSVAEHKEISDHLEKLQKMPVEDPDWMATFSRMRERYEHHIDEEEDEIFAKAQKVLADRESEDAGNRFEARKAEELDDRL